MKFKCEHLSQINFLESTFVVVFLWTLNNECELFVEPYAGICYFKKY